MLQITYKQAAKAIIDQDGWRGLFGRGLGTRLGTNALQASIFTVIWKYAPRRRGRLEPLVCPPGGVWSQLTYDRVPHVDVRRLGEEQLTKNGLI